MEKNFYTQNFLIRENLFLAPVPAHVRVVGVAVDAVVGVINLC